MFESVNQNVKFPELEEKIIRFWNDDRVFQASLEKPSPKGNYVFYEGPPTANGRPGIHHVSARAFKDLYPRYKTMRGYCVQRRGGWDTHGLPVEVEIEKEIGSTGKQDIEKFGIAEFNRLCRDSVFRYIQDWNKLTERIGFWIDLDDAYITYNNSYIETCWWILKSLWERGLLYEDYKTTMHCPRCHTSLADHEVSQGMREDVDDPSVWPKFPAQSGELISLGLLSADETRAVSYLAWTTTPWTLGANTALAVRGDEQYGLFESKPVYGKEDEEERTELFILAHSLADRVFGEGNYRVLKTFPGDALVGLRYEQILQGRASETEDLSKGFRIVADDFVSIEDGTGIVHIAPAYGDLEIGRKHNLPTVFSVDLAGKVYPEVKAPDSSEQVGPYSGMFFKDADKRITRDLTARGLMFRSERVRHAYPFCWRDDSPLLFYAKTSWYIRTTAVKDKLLENNRKINWIPEHVKTGRFGRWLENNIDWAISRERYWGTPLPIWTSEDGEDKICVGSIRELEELTGRELNDPDLHRPYMDEVTFERNGQTYKRVPYTIDVWFESGAMPYAQWHYPFENREQFLKRFPADYICEAMDQTRGWFYSLHALATLLTDEGDAASGRASGALAREGFNATSAFKNCVVLGFINDEKGQKMSKSRKNAVDPWAVLQEQGADALRWYMYVTSPPEANKNFHPRFVTEVVRDFLLTLWNVYSFFVIYANLDEPDLQTPLGVAERPEIDRWLISKLQRLIEKVTRDLDDYNVTDASRTIGEFVVRDLSNWYVRRNRRRFWKSEADADKRAAYVTLYETLITISKLCAPMIPFVTEAMYRNLVLNVQPDAPSSVHLSEWPESDASLIDEALLQEMELLIKLIDLGRAARSAAAIQFRQPLPEILVRVGTDEEMSALRRLENQLKEELNVKQVSFLDFDSDFINYGLRPNLPVVGKLLGKRVPEFVKALHDIDARQVADNVRRGVQTSIRLNDEMLPFEPSAFLVDVKSPEGYAAVEEGSYLVALNTTLTPELIMEGQARSVLRHVQNARKKANLNISDYIDLGLSTKKELTAALKAQEEYVKAEGLATSLVYDVLAPADYAEEVSLDGVPVIITLRRAGNSKPESID
ncbi:MAG TPA: isoleucine--tRNA ligase [Pyrinomonadaceae bacterium]|jgi:isoleucyl-tRNA synthetase